MNTKDYIKSLDHNFIIEEYNEDFEITLEDWYTPITIDLDDDICDVNKKLEFMSYNYIKHYGCYRDNYLEILVTHPDIFFHDYYEIPEMKAHPKKLTLKSVQ